MTRWWHNIDKYLNICVQRLRLEFAILVFAIIAARPEYEKMLKSFHLTVERNYIIYCTKVIYYSY